MKRIAIFILFLITIGFAETSYSQDFQNIDPKTINVDNLTDEQIQQFVNRAQSSGMTQSQLEEIARQRGMSEVEISKLRTRIYTLNPDLAEMDQEAGTTNSLSRLRENPVNNDIFNSTFN